MVDLGLLNDVLDAFDRASSGWALILLPISLNLFRALAILEFSWTFWTLLISHRATWETIFEVLLRKTVFFGFLHFLIEKSPALLSIILSSFQLAGGSAAGITALRPSSFLATGSYCSVLLLQRVDQAGLLTDPLGTLVAAIGSAAVLLAFASMAATITITLIEITLVYAACFVLLGFAASRWTFSLAEAALSTVVRKGVSLFITYLLASILNELTVQWAERLASSEFVGPFELFTFLGTVVVCAVLLWTAPRLSSQLVPTQIHFGLNPHAQSL